MWSGGDVYVSELCEQADFRRGSLIEEPNVLLLFTATDLANLKSAWQLMRKTTQD